MGTIWSNALAPYGLQQSPWFSYDRGSVQYPQRVWHPHETSKVTKNVFK